MKVRKPLLVLLLAGCLSAGAQTPQSPDIIQLDRARVMNAAQADLAEQPLTITAFPAPRSSGGPHDFFSEGDYWWPDPAHPGGPYIQRDGLSNPDNFDLHRRALLRFSVQAPALVAAWKLTGDKRYADHAAAHLRAWFIDPQTRLNPTLQYAQAIFGRSQGRGIGIIDTLHLVEVARAIEVLEAGDTLSKTEQTTDRPVVHGLPAVAHPQQERPGRARRQEQPWHLLAVAGGRLRPPDRRRGAPRVCARALQDRAAAGPAGI